MTPRKEVVSSPDRLSTEGLPQGEAEVGVVPDEDRPVDPQADELERVAETSLRPKKLAEFAGQPQLTEHLQIVLEAAKQRGHAADHLLFAGPPGLGKTTLASIVAAEMDAALKITSGAALTRSGDLASMLTDLNDGDVLFVDEIHRLPRAVEEVLYPAMEDFQLDIILGKGPAARSLRLDLPRFTLVGATTRTGLITGPLRDRFGFVARLDYYEPGSLRSIVQRAAGVLGVDITPEGAEQIARRSRGTPRIANRLLRRVRDFAQVRKAGTINTEVADEGLVLFGVDALGLDKIDRAILDCMVNRFGGGPVGLSTIAVSIGEDADTVEDVYEPFLIQCGLLQRTPRGRMATPAAWTHLGLPVPANAGESTGSLFD